MFGFEIEKTLAELSNTSKTAKRVTLTSWNGRPAKIDIRSWRTGEDEILPGKGIVLTNDEAKALIKALTPYLAHFPDKV